MKKLLSLMLVMLVSGLWAQMSDTGRNASNLGQAMLAGANAGNIGTTAMFVNPPTNIDGTVHLFENWNNLAVIFTSDDQKFSLKNLNLNLERHAFESKISETEIFTFNYNNIDKIVVNNRTFKNYYYKDSNRVFEVLYENDEAQLLKGYVVNLVEASTNPMLNRPNDKYVIKDKYYIKEHDEIKPFKLKKKNVLKFVDGNKSQADQIMKQSQIQ